MKAVFLLVRSASMLAIALALSACGQRGLQLFTHPNPKVPNLHGTTIAAFPPLAIGRELGPSMVALETLDAVFAAEFAGIRFIPPSEVVARTALSEEESALMAEQMSGFLPIEVEPKRLRKRVFASGRIGETDLPGPLLVTLQRDPYPKKQLSPAALPPRLFAGLDADYALLTVTFSGYERVSRTAAMLGIVPLAWERVIRAHGPRSLFALYEIESGARIWDVIVGLENRIRPDDATNAKRRIIDDRIMPVIGAAYLLTGDITTPLERAVSARAAE